VPIRVRLALMFASATLVLVAAGGFLFVRSLDHGLLESIDNGLTARAAVVSHAVRDASNQAVRAEEVAATALRRAHDESGQVLDASGRVLAVSGEAGSRPLLPASVLRTAASRPVFTMVSVDHEPVRVRASPSADHVGRRILVVGSSLESAHAAVTRVRTGLWFGGGIAVIIAGVGAWALATAALRPVERMRATAADISDRDTASHLPVPRTRDEIAALATTMNDLLGRLQAAVARERTFVADAGHELRTPLAVLRMELELATSRTRSREELQDAIASAARETDRLTHLAEDLLYLSLADVGQEADGIELLPIAAVLADSARTLEARATARCVTVALQARPDVVAPVDGRTMRRAVDNLLDNALRCASPGSIVEADVRREGSHIVVEVRDRGPGFPAEFLPHAFERFRRADTARARSDGGTGLGLAIVAAVARQHRGTAVAGNRAGGGAFVQLRIPDGSVIGPPLVSATSSDSSV
jgi:heavy metal sensor kinase